MNALAVRDIAACIDRNYIAKADPEIFSNDLQKEKS